LPELNALLSAAQNQREFLALGSATGATMGVGEKAGRVRVSFSRIIKVFGFFQKELWER